MEWQNPYNPFNSAKLFAHVDTWRPLAKGEAPPPVLVTIDPANACNLKCSYCNAAKVTGLGTKIPESLNVPLAEFLHKWGVRAVCVAGGGEPLLNPGIIAPLCEAGIRVGVVTNGLLIEGRRQSLRQCDWVGVSVDAATPQTYLDLKKVNAFDCVIENIRRCSADILGDSKSRGHGVFFKYLIVPGNEREIADAARLARDLGCRGFHARPAGMPGTNAAVAGEQCAEAQELGTEDFSVYTVTHKVGADMGKHNDFEQCWGMFLTCIITPHPEGFNVDLCCDRRGDKSMRLAEGLTNPEQILDVWGSDKHWAIQGRVNPEKCPRCTYGPHAKIIENVIIKDHMLPDFI